MKHPAWMILTVWLLAIVPYIINAYKFAGCDFEANYKCEIIHGIGVGAPPASYITMWFDDDRVGV